MAFADEQLVSCHRLAVGGFRTVHEVIAEEYRILESVNCELATYTPGDWVKLFEVRFSFEDSAISSALPAGDSFNSRAHHSQA